MDEELIINLEPTILPTRTYRVHRGRIIGHTDGLEAIAQAVDKILRTERFAYAIYTANYGVELERFIGENFDFVKADLERTILDALIVDERIYGISNFEMEQTDKNTLHCKFTVNTIEGIYNAEAEVVL